MSEQIRDWTQTDGIDELLMQASEGDDASIKSLTRLLTEAVPTEMAGWDKEVRDVWEVGLDLLFEVLDRAQLSEAGIDLVYRLACAGYDTDLFRDALAASAKKRFASYLDAAGMQLSLGIRDARTSTTDIARKWKVFGHLQAGITCWHQAHGVGHIETVDGISNQVHLFFRRRTTMPLQTVLSTLVTVAPSSALAQLLDGSLTWGDAVASPGLIGQLGTSLVSVDSPPDNLLQTFLIPDVISDSEFAATRRKSRRSEPDATEPEAGAARRWYEARALAELADLLRRHEPTEAPPEAVDNVGRILAPSARRKDQAELLSETIAMLWNFAPRSPWLVQLLRATADEAICWQDLDLFVKLSDKLPGRLLPAWCAATAAALSPEFLADACMQLPLRLWGHVERHLCDIEMPELLLQTALEYLRRGDVSADVMLWLWKRDGADAQCLADPTLLFRTLAKPTKGSFIKARKELRKLLIDSPDFQRLFTHEGSEKGIINLVRCARHLNLLSAGEQQSLLVKIVRQYPESRPLVEERKQAVARRPIGKITSARSFELRLRELEELVNVKVPANAKAIAHARSYGDLRENAEYKAAKEEQAYLAARRAELEESVHETRATDFSDVVVRERAVPGCSVTIEHQDGQRQTYFLLGLWDSVPERNMVSYETPLGEALLGTRVGDRMQTPAGDDVVVAKLAPLPDDIRQWLTGDESD